MSCPENLFFVMQMEKYINKKYIADLIDFYAHKNKIEIGIEPFKK